MPIPSEILNTGYTRALAIGAITNQDIGRRIVTVCRSYNRAGVRLLLSCLVAKIHNPNNDIRKPYTEIGTPDSFSGRSYDERDVEPFILNHNLPCNPTTAFLTPALRNRNFVLTPDVQLVGRPPGMYHAMLLLLNDIHENILSPEELLAYILKELLVYKQERQNRLQALLENVEDTDTHGLSSEHILALIEQHVASPRSSRLPVLIVAAAYIAAEPYLQEKVKPLLSHNAADKQTGAAGDIEITLINDANVVTCYEMKDKSVTHDDLTKALQKLETHSGNIDNYIFITTDVINENVREYARALYDVTGGTEFAILNYIGFLRHYLHLFHRIRMKFLDEYQRLLLVEPESAVRQELKETFLSLRRAVESR